MGFLQLQGIPDFAQCVISLWFRVPQASMDRAKAAATGEPGALLDGIIPLVVMGKRGTGQIQYAHTYPSYPEPAGEKVLFYNLYGNSIHGDYNINGSNDDCSWGPVPGEPYPTYGYINPLIQTGPAPDTDPTFIGVDSWGNLLVNFETGVIPTVSGIQASLNSIGPGEEVQAVSDYGGDFFTPEPMPGSYNAWGDFVYDSTAAYFLQGTGPSRHPVYAPGGHDIIRYTTSYSDISSWVLSTTGVITNTGNQSVTAGTWHHLLVSLDLKPIVSHGTDAAIPPDFTATGQAPWVDSASKLYIAVDDKNYLGFDLSQNWNWNGNPGQPNNEVITKDAAFVAGSGAFTDTYQSQTENQMVIGIPQYTMGASVIPCGGMPLGIPARATEIANIYRVEMAEFQMFTGVTLDTGVEKNRRMFITAKGAPVNPELRTTLLTQAVGDPTTWEPGADFIQPAFDPGTSGSRNKVLGRPIIDFTKSNRNWIEGRNLGTLSGRAMKTGRIKPFTPEPRVGK